MMGLRFIALFAGAMALLSTSILVGRWLAARRKYYKTLAERALTINHLLTFSQTMQGAGRADQVYSSLCHFLRTELELSGLTILSHDPESTPPTVIQAYWPDNLVVNPSGSPEFETSQCPCLRQSLPWVFQPGNSPLRCTLDASLRLPTTHPAYCVPFNFGRKIRVAVHMLLEPGEVWTEQRRQIAQAYVNTAQASLSSLHLLSEAEKQSLTDPLTGLFNRRSLEQFLGREVALAERYKHPFSLVMVDVDHFKDINDNHGHAAGDYVLKAFADCVRMTLRKTDLAFRYGGDEFVIALPQTNLDQAWQVMQKLRQAFMAVDFSSAISKMEGHPTLSIGVTERSIAGNILSASQLLGAADTALYAAKSDHRDCIKIYEPSQAA
jgi:diguanylate cyclase (GGDEF)-like protein